MRAMSIVPFIRISASCTDLCSYSNVQNIKFAFSIFKAFSLQKQITRKLHPLLVSYSKISLVPKSTACFNSQNSIPVKNHLTPIYHQTWKVSAWKELQHLPPHPGPQSLSEQLWLQAWIKGMSLSMTAVWALQKWRDDHRGDPAQGIG